MSLCSCGGTKYQKWISHLLLDRIDIHIKVPRVDYEKLSGDRIGESSESIRARVQAARDNQLKRFSKNGSSDIVCNADMRIGEIRKLCRIQNEGGVLSRAKASELNAGGDIVPVYEPTQFFGTRLSSHAKREVRAHDGRFSEE